MLLYYLLTLGIFLACAGTFEICLPLKAFAFWKKWSSSKFFFLHGILLIAAGFPLTIYTGPLSWLIFVMGLLAVLTGPFVLIYPDKFKMMFGAAAEELKDPTIKKMVVAEGAVRIAVGTACIAVFFLN
jgi:hypothetical protein